MDARSSVSDRRRPPRTPLGRGLAAVAAGLVCALALPLAAHAAPGKQSRKKAIWGPVLVNGKSQFPIYRDLGVGIYQQALPWASIAPTRPANPRDPDDPAYQWPLEADLAVREAPKYKIKVAFMVLTTPSWANGGRAPNYAPDRPSDYADFMEAAAKRYKNVRHWLVWGEPSRVANWAPITAEYRLGDNLNSVQARAPRKYARMLDRTYGRLKKLNRRNLIVGGNTFTAGDISPWNWIRYMKLPSGKPPRMDLYGHNPFGTRTPDLSDRQLKRPYADFSDLDTLAGWLDRYLERRDRNRNLRIFISEYTAPTDVSSFEFNFHVTRAVQARWLTAGMRITRSWPRIYTFGWLGLRDPVTTGGESRTGLIDAKGRRKPAYYAYKRG